MESEAGIKILQEIDEILNSIGQADYDAFRSTMQRASTLLANLAIWSGKTATLTRDDLILLVQKRPVADQERIYRLLKGLKDSLPKFGDTLVKAAAQIFPADQGGRPKSFEERDTQRQAVARILALIAADKKESQAQRIAAGEFKVSYQTMHRTWEKRVELAELSFGEFFDRLLKALSKTDATVVPESSTGEGAGHTKAIDQQDGDADKI